EEALVRKLGGALARAGAAREVNAEAEQHGDTEARAERELGQVAALLRERGARGREAHVDVAVGDGVSVLDRVLVVAPRVGGDGGINAFAANGDLEMVIGVEPVD